MGVYLGYVYGAMPEYFLDIADVNVRFQETCGEGVAEHVRGDMQGYLGQGRVFVYHPADGLV